MPSMRRQLLPRHPCELRLPQGLVRSSGVSVAAVNLLFLWNVEFIERSKPGLVGNVEIYLYVTEISVILRNENCALSSEQSESVLAQTRALSCCYAHRLTPCGCLLLSNSDPLQMLHRQLLPLHPCESHLPQYRVREVCRWLP